MKTKIPFLTSSEQTTLTVSNQVQAIMDMVHFTVSVICSTLLI
jgi:hypothetical protein